MEWGTAPEGVDVHKPKYGMIVTHDVAKKEFNMSIDSTDETIERLEHKNSIPIEKLLRSEEKRAKLTIIRSSFSLQTIFHLDVSLPRQVLQRESLCA